MSGRCILRAGWIATTAALLLTTVARADVSIAQWDTTGYAGTEAVVTPTQMATGVTADDISRSTGLVPNAGANNYNSANWSLGQFVQLGITTTSEWDVTSLLLATRSSATGPGLMDVNASVDGGAFTRVGQITQPSASYVDQLLTFSSVLDVHSSLVIQLTPDNNTAANGGTIGTLGTWRIGDYESPQGVFSPITLNGVAVPEPSSLVICGVALACLGVTTRLRRHGEA
jgi:hypothetical protein